METTLTERQQKWFASVRASLQRDTGKTLEQWVAIARTCPETRPRARTAWLKEHYGLGVNRAAQILNEAFPPEHGWDDAAPQRAALWSDPATLAILEAVEAAIAELPPERPSIAHGQRKAFAAWSRNFQFAALKPVKGGAATLGLAVPQTTDSRLLPPRNEGWSDRLKSKLTLASPASVDASVKALLRQAWEAS